MPRPAGWPAEDIARFNKNMLEQVFHRWMGVKLVSQTDGEAICQIEVDDHTDGGGGYLHGGIAEAALDVVAWFAAITTVPAGYWIRTSTSQYSLMRAALRGHTVELRAKVDRSGRTTIFVRVEAWGVDEQGNRALLITGQIVKSLVKVDGAAPGDG
ncbi:MAG: hypothetical protein KC912_20785 [Proteobacteria bacterium]|nr:hypothetical protein [Pseudomonadota bacterium]